MLTYFEKVKRRILALLRMPQMLHEIKVGIDNQSNDLFRSLAQVRDDLDLLDERLTEIAQGPSSPPQSSKVESYEIRPIVDIPFEAIGGQNVDPILAISQMPTFESIAKFFADSPSASRSLVSPEAQAVLYSLVRQFRPRKVVEIGTFKAATTEAIARALLANGYGLLDTIDPFGAKTVRPIFAAWPAELRKTTIFYPMNSMEYFAEMQQRRHEADLIFVDGNHDFEYAFFDIESSARCLSPGGFIVIDNISQPGPFMASRDFLARHGGWRECGNTLGNLNWRTPYNADRTKIKNTDFCILQAPPLIVIDKRPMTPGEIPFTTGLKGVQIEFSNKSSGTLHIQFVIRTFGATPNELIITESVNIVVGQSEVRIPIDFTSSEPPDVRQSVEPWLTWDGAEDLRLSSNPRIF